MQPTKTVNERLATTSDETELKASATRDTTNCPLPEDGYLTVRESVHYEEVPELRESATRVTTHGLPPEDGYLIGCVRESVQYQEIPELRESAATITTRGLPPEDGYLTVR